MEPEETLEQKVMRYEQALIQIVCVLEPLGWRCPDHHCEGCRYEHDDALTSAMNVLAGLAHHAQFGPPHRLVLMPDGTKVKKPFCTPQARCQACIDHHPTRDEIDAAWTSRGFRQVIKAPHGLLWGRGTAF